MRGGVSSTQGNIWKREEEWNYEHERTTIFLRLATYMYAHIHRARLLPELLKLSSMRNRPPQPHFLDQKNWDWFHVPPFIPSLSHNTTSCSCWSHTWSLYTYILANIVSDTSLYEPWTRSLPSIPLVMKAGGKKIRTDVSFMRPYFLLFISSAPVSVRIRKNWRWIELNDRANASGGWSDIRYRGLTSGGGHLMDWTKRFDHKSIGR